MSRQIPALAALLLSVLPAAAQNPTYRFQTNLGNIDVVLRPDAAPNTVANFLQYVNSGAYTNTIIQRLVSGFVFQTGGYTVTNGTVAPIPAKAAIQNEFKLSNVRGTLAMALSAGNPNSATDEFFFNLADNGGPPNNMDSSNGPFAVFGQVADSASLAVMDKIAALPIYDLSGSLGAEFSTTPLVNVFNSNLTVSNLVVIQSIQPLGGSPGSSNVAVTGMITASAFGAYSTAAPGSFLEIYGTNLAGTTRGWATSDFSGLQKTYAPVSLDGVSVTVGGHSAYVSYVSPTQVNVQVPATAAVSGSVPVVVTYNGQASNAMNLTMQPLSGGVLAPASFLVSGRQYAVAMHQNGDFVGNGKVPGAGAVPAAAGETITFYGTGFGPVTTNEAIAGQIVSGLNSLVNTVEFDFGSTVAAPQYAGLAPGLVGLDQFNVRVPAGLPPGDVALTVKVNGKPVSQTLYLSVQGN